MLAVSDYFDMVIYDRFLKYFNSSRSPSPFMLSQEKPRFAGFNAIVDAVDKTFGVVLKMFSSSSKTEIIGQFTKVGFASYENDVTIQYYLGVAAS